MPGDGSQLPTTAAPHPANFVREDARPVEASAPITPPPAPEKDRARRQLAILVRDRYLIVVDAPPKP